MKAGQARHQPGTGTELESLAGIVLDRLRRNRPIRRSLPVWGRLAIDRQVPFLCLYRRPVKAADAGTELLVTSEASYLTCSAARGQHQGLATLVQQVARLMVEQFGAFLLLELWTATPPVSNGPVTTADLAPRFKILSPKDDPGPASELHDALTRVKVSGHRAIVSRTSSARCWPKGMAPLVPVAQASAIGCRLLGLELAPVFRDPGDGVLFPRVLRQLRRTLSVALRRALFEFVQTYTTHRPPHFHALGKRAMVKAVWEVDRQLAEMADQFDLLLLVTPVNGKQAWQEFKRSGCERTPVLHYRPLPAEPIVLKRRLLKAPVERIEDPALAQLFREKLVDVDRQITMLQDRNTARFLHESIQLYGAVDDDLLMEAEQVLAGIPPGTRSGRGEGSLSAAEFAERARREIKYLRQQHAAVRARVELRPDVAGLLVSHGNLLVSTGSKVPARRAEALIQHEVGTHVLTYYNGRAQRLRQLAVGLAGYDALQEGLAVLAEHLVGGLNRPRLRLLAGRVIAVHLVIQGASFVEVHRELERTHGFAREVAFGVTLRIFRGGGLTKDAVYLRGLLQILDYLGRGGAVEPLLVGKIAIQHVPIVRELLWRGVLCPPPLTPRYLTRPDALARLDRLRHGATLRDLWKGATR